MSSSTRFASQGSSFSGSGSTTTSSSSMAGVDTATVRYGTVLQSGQSAVYPTSFLTDPGHSSNRANSSRHSLNAGAIAGIVVGALAGGFLVGVLAFFLLKRSRAASRRRKRESAQGLLPTMQERRTATVAGTAGQPLPAQSASHPGYGTGTSGFGGDAAAAGLALPQPSRKPWRSHNRDSSTSSTVPFANRPQSSDSYQSPRFSTDSSPTPYSIPPSPSPVQQPVFERNSP